MLFVLLKYIVVCLKSSVHLNGFRCVSPQGLLSHSVICAQTMHFTIYFTQSFTVELGPCVETVEVLLHFPHHAYTGQWETVLLAHRWCLHSGPRWWIINMAQNVKGNVRLTLGCLFCFLFFRRTKKGNTVIRGEYNHQTTQTERRSVFCPVL